MKINSDLFILLSVFLIGACLYIPIGAYSDASFYVGTHDTRPTGVAFSTDGSKMFVSGNTNVHVFEYALSVPFNVTSSILVDSVSVGSLGASITDVTFSTNGTKMFVGNSASSIIYGYTLSVPFNVTSSTLTESPFLPNLGSISGISFSTNGTKMFTITDSATIREYALSVPFNVTSSIFVNTISVSSQDTFPQGIAFSTSGSKMFVLGNANDKVFEYSLSTPFVVNSPTFTDSFNVGSQDDIPTGIAFSTNGTKMFIVGSHNDAVYEYTLPALFDLVDTASPTFTAKSYSFTQTAITFSERVNGTLIFSDWSFDGNVPTAVSEHSDGNTLSDVTFLVFTHNTTNDQTPNVAYTGNSLTDSFSNGVTIGTVTAVDGIPLFITNITSDAAAFGTLKVGDTITFTLTPGSTENGATISGTYNSVPLFWNSIDNGATFVATYTISEGDTDHTTPLQITNVTITDSPGNPSLPFNGTDILKTIDANSPVITLNGSNPQTIEQGAGYTELNATTNDDSTITINSANFTDAVGTYTIYYDSTDTAGNNAIQVNRTVNVVDTTSPTLSSAVLNEGTGTFTITFNEIINASAINSAGFSIRDNNNTSTGTITLSNLELTTTANGAIISFNMTMANRQSVIAFNVSVLDIGAGAVRDISGNTIIMSTDNSITTTLDTIPPTLTFTSITPNNGTLGIGDDIVIQINANNETGLTLLSGTINNETITLSETTSTLSETTSASSFDYRKTITINNTMVSGSAEHTNFPLLVSIQNDPNLNNATVQASGQDIRFTTINDTPLHYEITSFSNNHTSGSLSAWIMIPTLYASNDTKIYMYYSNSIVTDGQNATAVWDSDYDGVWHFDGDMLDSTSNDNDGTNFNSIGTTGIIGGARSFDGNDYISYSDAEFPSGNNPRTLSAWVNHSSLPANYHGVLVYGTGDTSQAYGLLQNSNNLIVGGYSDDITLNTTPTTNDWYHFTMTYDGTTVRTYIDGSPDANGTKSWNTVLNEFRVGQQVNNSNEFFSGQIDEIRISDTVRTADWIKTEYNNQNSGSFYSVSAPEKLVLPFYYDLTYTVAEGDTDIDDATAGITYNITLVDTVGNPSTLAATLPSISSPGVDANSPIITLNGLNPQIIEQGAGYTELNATTNDGSTITINSANFTDAIGIYTIYYDSTDTAGNNAIQVNRTVNVVDTTSPTFLSAVLNEGTGTFTITFNEIINASAINSAGFSIRDNNNNTSTDTITLSNLELTTTANGATISFNMTMANRQSVIAFNVSVLDISTGAVQDINGNAITLSANNTITTTLDGIPPVISLLGDNPQTIEQGAGYTELGATTSDGSPVTINNTEFIDAVGTYSIYYDSTDTAGNTAIQINRTVNVVDTTSPTFLSAVLNEGTGTFTITFNEIINASAINSTGFSIRDNNNNTSTEVITLSNLELTTTANGAIISFNMTMVNRQSVIAFNVSVLDIGAGAVRDINGNAITLSANNTITTTLDGIPPVISLLGDNPQTIEQGAGYTELGATTNDGSTITINSANFTDAVGSYYIYYDSTDTAGNNAIQINRTVNVVDTTLPVISLIGDNPQTIEQGAGYTELNATTNDGSAITINSANFTDAVGSYYIYYDSTDTAGNNAIQVNRTVNVVDTTLPVISLIGDNPQTIEQGAGYTELNATTNDGSTITINSANFTDAVGIYTIYYDSTDTAGNNAIQVNRTVIVSDTTPPTFSSAVLNEGTGTFTITFNEIINASAINPAGFSIRDNNNNISTGTVTLSNLELTTTANGATISFNMTMANRQSVIAFNVSVLDISTGAVQDINGNAITLSANNIITTTSDATPPVISLIGDNPQTIEQGAGYTELNATTNDGSPVTINSAEFIDAVGTYHIYYDSTDTAGNNAIQVNRTVIVSDTTPPTFSSAVLNEGTGTFTITFNEIINASAINPAGFSIRDNNNNTSTGTVTLSNLELTTTANGATISFNMSLTNRQSVIAFNVLVLDISTGAVQDINGNAIILSANNTITTISDTIPPILTFTSITPNNGTLGIGDDIVIQINANNETGLTLLSGTINNETITLSETTPTLSETTSASSFDYRKTITINNTMVSGSAEHTNFPLLVSIQNDPNLNNATVQASGQDIRFTTINDTPLHYEITSFSNNHISGSLSAWIMIPTLYASNDTKIYMYYSNSIVTDGQNATAVWNSDYDGVWHFDGDMLDSTSNDNDGTNFNSTGTTGIIGGARSFDGNDYISYSDSEFPSGNSSRTLSAWVSHSSLQVGFHGVLVYGTGDVGQAYGLFQNSNNLIVGGFGDDITLNTTLTTNDWYHFAMTYDGTTVRTYIDGSPDANGTKSWSTVLNEFRVGQQVNDFDEFFTGQIDEIRISDTVRTADWIKTEYNNQNSGSFYSVSAPEKLVMSFYYDLTYTVAEGDTDVDDATAGITYNITLVDTVGNPSTLAATIPSISSPGVDANSPVITLNGSNPQIIEQGAGYTELDATTNDGSPITINSANFTDAVGTYTIYYDSTDTAGNSAIQVNRTVNVVDTTSPVITLNGTNPQTIEQGAGYTELNATTNDGSTITINSANFTDLVGTYHIYYDSTDAFNNTAIQVNRTVNVVDTTVPVITLNGTNPQTIEQGAGYTELGATTNDGSIITINSANFTDLVGTYHIYYDSTDAFNNTAIQVNRTVNVVDTTPPTFASAVLNEGTGTFTITFNETINASSINSAGFSIRDNNNNTSTGSITLSTLELTTTANGATISFNMTLTNRQSVIAFNVSVLDIGASAVQDINGNAITLSANNIITTTLDTIPPTLTFTSITPNNGTLGIGDDIVIQINTNNETGLTLLSGTINNETITLSEITPTLSEITSTSSFDYRKTITINNTMVSGSAEHTNFPLLVSIQNDPNLNNATVQASGQDIRFTTINDTPLHYEITSFSNNHISGSLSAWIMIPTLYASNDTKIYMYYSNSIVTDGQNATAVWDSDYDGVWHFDGDMLDSTSNDNDGTNFNSTGTTGIIGGARSFDGNDYISYSDSVFPSGNSTRTLSAWVSHSSLLSTLQAVLVYGTGNTGQAYGLFQLSSELLVGGYSDDITLNTIPTTNDWYHFAMTYDGTTVRTYIDGSPDANGTKSWSTVLNEFRVGQQVNNADQFFTGQIDEIRISDTVRTADWIKTEYNNQNSGSFYSVSAPEKLVMSFYYDLTYTVAEGDTDIDDATKGIAYNITLVDTVGNPSTLAATIPSISSPGVDANSPVITLNGLNPQIIEQGAGYTELGATTNDGSPITINSANFTDAVGTYTIYYDSTDTAGNNAIQVNRTVNVVDNTAPVIILNGANPQTIELGNGYTELNATTNDGSTITINSANFTDIVGTYYVYYDSTDAFNNTAQVIRTIIVVDNTLPAFSSAVLNEGTGIFTIAFNKPINVSAINSTGFSIRDNNTSIDAVTLSTLELITTANGTTISFNMTMANRQSVIAFNVSVLDISTGAVQDIYGNQIVATTGNPIATTSDTIPPVISLLGNNPQTIEQGAGYTELNATTNDGSPITINSANFTDILGTYTIYYDSVDISGNNAIQVNRTVIVSDTTPPVITLNGANPQTIELGDGYTELNATTNDGSTITINSTNFTDTLGTYTIYYDSVDASGNNAIQVNRTVIVSDTTPPVITLNGANPQTIELGDGYTELNATTNDGSTITINSTNFTDTLGTYTIYYDSVDASGNSAIQVNRTVIVSDTTPSDPCVIPDSGDWIITNSCTLDANADAPESVIVQNGSVLNIPSGITLNIDFTTFNLTVQSGGGVLIKSGGTLT